MKEDVKTGGLMSVIVAILIKILVVIKLIVLIKILVVIKVAKTIRVLHREHEVEAIGA